MNNQPAEKNNEGMEIGQKHGQREREVQISFHFSLLIAEFGCRGHAHPPQDSGARPRSPRTGAEGVGEFFSMTNQNLCQKPRPGFCRFFDLPLFPTAHCVSKSHVLTLSELEISLLIL